MRGADQLAGSMAEASETIISIVAGVGETPRPTVGGQGVWATEDMVGGRSTDPGGGRQGWGEEAVQLSGYELMYAGRAC